MGWFVGSPRFMLPKKIMVDVRNDTVLKPHIWDHAIGVYNMRGREWDCDCLCVDQLVGSCEDIKCLCQRLELCCRLFTALRWENWNSSRIGIDLKTPEMGRFTAGIGRVSVRKGLATKSSLKLRCMLLGLRKWDSPENLSCSKHTCHTCHLRSYLICIHSI